MDFFQMSIIIIYLVDLKNDDKQHVLLPQHVDFDVQYDTWWFKCNFCYVI